MQGKLSQKQHQSLRWIRLVNNILLGIFISILVIFVIFILEPGIMFNLIYKLDNTKELNSLPMTVKQQNLQASVGSWQNGIKDETLVVEVKDNSPLNNSESPRLYKNFMFQKLHAILEIPSIQVRGPVISGDNEHIMEKGFWHVNTNGAWLQAGNIVIFGHRFYHLPPKQDTFFNLDKVKVGDSVMIYTDIGTWSYTVIGVKVVDRNDFSIFKNTKDPQLTLVTCHPLWTSKKRLVVIAKLISTLYF